MRVNGKIEDVMEMEFLHGHLELDMKDNIKLINDMDQEHLSIQMDLFIQENGKKIYVQEKANLLRQMKKALLIMKVIFKMTSIMEKVYLSGSLRQRLLKILNIKVNGSKVNKTASESLPMMMEAFMKVVGKKIKETAREKCNGRQRKVFLCMMENGKMI